MNVHPRWQRSAGSIGQACLSMRYVIMALMLLVPSLGETQVTTNITSSGLNTQVNQAGNSYNITGGTRPGGGQNLFHSFGNFSVGGGDLANFLNNTGLPTSNILGRVTDGTISNIDGTIQTTGFGNANLFLMNPSGIVLGPGASLNVDGSVSFTTAQYIRLLDGLFNNANFYANPANDGLVNSILTINASAFEFVSASAAGYGFLTAPDPNTTITLQGSNLSVPSGQSISLVGGKVVIEGGAKLTAPGGSIKLASAASPGEFDTLTLDRISNVDGASFTSYGSVSLTAGSSIDVHGSSTVLIKGGQLVLSMNDASLSTAGGVQPNTISLNPGSSINAWNFETDLGADIQLTAPRVNLNGSFIITQSDGTERGGNITVTANQLTLDQVAGIFTGTGVAGSGGNVLIQGPAGLGGVATSVMLSGNSQIGASTTGSGGLGGNITITSTSLELSGASNIFSSTDGGAASNGNILMRVQDAKLTGGSYIASRTDSNGLVGGSITVQGVNGGKATSLTLAGQDSGIRATTVAETQLGNILVQAETFKMLDGALIQSGEPLSFASAGTITIDAGLVDMTGQSRISSSVFNLNAGPITITADRITLNNSTIATESTSPTGGRGGDVILDVGSASFLNGATITSSASNTGNAGNIAIGASKSVAITGGSTITANTDGTGNAGAVTITAPTLQLDQARIATSTSNTGHAGNITIASGTVTLNSGSTISSASTGTEPTLNFDGTTAPPGRAGTITITASGDVKSNAGTITTSAEGNRGGDISITAGSLQLSNGSLINANSKGPRTVTQLVLDANGQLVEQVVGDGNAGNIRIESGSTVVIERSSVTTEASQASGGQITINAPDMIRLTDSHVSTSVAGSGNDSNGGNISIDPDFVILKNSQILAQAFAGSGGAIDITAGLFLGDASSAVDASSTLGVSGTVQINAPINNLSSVVAHLPESLLAVQALLRASCAAKLAQGSTSSFVERGRDGIPAGPDGLLAGPYLPPTASYAAQRPATASTGFSGIQLRRLFGQETPVSVTFLSDHGGCSS